MAFISTSNNKHVPLDLLSQRRSGFGVSALGSVEPGRAINTGWIPVDLGGMMGNRPKEEAIESQCADKIEIGRAAPQIHTHTHMHKKPTGSIKNAALIMLNKPWVDYIPAQPLFLT